MRTGDRKSRLLRGAIGVLAVVAASIGDVRAEGGAFLVKDINRIPVDEMDSFPSGFLTVGTKTFFRADDGVHGRELWVTDGTEEGTSMFDLNPGEEGSLPYNLTEMDGLLYFVTRDQTTDCSLWRSDGTESGTKDIVLFGESCVRSELRYPLTTVNGEIYFNRDDGVHGHELWKTDGTNAGTVLVRDIRPGEDGSSPGLLTELDGSLFFFANDGLNGGEPWISDGTESGTMIVADIYPGKNGYTLPLGNGELVTLGDTVFFSANDGVHGSEIWVSDGSGEGTRMLRDFNPGADGTFGQIENIVDLFGPWFGLILPFRDRVFFTTAAGTLQDGLAYSFWASDGTVEGTVVVHEFPRLGFYPRDLTEVGGNIFFTATAQAGNGLWTSDGSDGGTFIVKEADVGRLQLTSRLAELTDLGGNAFFLASDETYGCEIWRSDGTAPGTYRLSDIHPSTMPCYEGPPSSTPRELTVNQEMLLFSADDGVHGSELFRSDGTESGTVLVKDLNPPGRTESALSATPWLATINDILLFRADSGEDSEQLVWRTDGTPEGTFPIPALNSGMGKSAEVNGVLVFSGFDPEHGSELWGSDATVAGTRLIKDLTPGEQSSSLLMIGSVGDTAFFIATVQGDRNLWRTDGTEIGTVPLERLRASVYLPYSALAVLDGTLVFLDSGQIWASSATGEDVTLLWPPEVPAGDAGAASYFIQTDELVFFMVGTELWRTDGSVAGTIRVRRIESAHPDFPRFDFIRSQDKVYFASREASGQGLWVSNGTEEGTLRLAKIYGVPVATAEGLVFFYGFEESTGYELWRSDGTVDGTHLVKEIYPGRPSSIPRVRRPSLELTVIGNTLYFLADDGAHGPELWISDGTEEGTNLVADVDPRQVEDDEELHLNFSNVQGRLVFWPFAPEFGIEPWVSDGTPQGTRILADVAPRGLSSGRHREEATPIVVGSRMFFIADDRIHGRELWALPLRSLTRCPGDCDDNGTVTVDELIVGLDISLGTSALATCPAFDLDGRGDLTIDELIAGVQSALDGCG